MSYDSHGNLIDKEVIQANFLFQQPEQKTFNPFENFQKDPISTESGNPFEDEFHLVGEDNESSDDFIEEDEIDDENEYILNTRVDSELVPTPFGNHQITPSEFFMDIDRASQFLTFDSGNQGNKQVMDSFLDECFNELGKSISGIGTGSGGSEEESYESEEDSGEEAVEKDDNVYESIYVEDPIDIFQFQKNDAVSKKKKKFKQDLNREAKNVTGKSQNFNQNQKRDKKKKSKRNKKKNKDNQNWKKDNNNKKKKKNKKENSQRSKKTKNTQILNSNEADLSNIQSTYKRVKETSETFNDKIMEEFKLIHKKFTKGEFTHFLCFPLWHLKCRKLYEYRVSLIFKKIRNLWLTYSIKRLLLWLNW